MHVEEENLMRTDEAFPAVVEFSGRWPPQLICGYTFTLKTELSGPAAYV